MSAIPTGLACAHAYRQAHGHLAVPYECVTEDGFRLGAWLRGSAARPGPGECPKPPLSL
ncbi:helicase associated domain-containing protein [Streptomyces acidicola]|uniref:helicase associated domain-containing protein n=1 Tax=Streptomyces acidicola TaxID=2596892 RepID=UPI0037A6699F